MNLFLGMESKRMSDGSYTMGQQHYIERMAKRFLRLISIRRNMGLLYQYIGDFAFMDFSQNRVGLKARWSQSSMLPA